MLTYYVCVQVSTVVILHTLILVHVLQATNFLDKYIHQYIMDLTLSQL